MSMFIQDIWNVLANQTELQLTAGHICTILNRRVTGDLPVQISDVETCLKALVAQGRVRSETQNEQIFYSIVPPLSGLKAKELPLSLKTSEQLLESAVWRILADQTEPITMRSVWAMYKGDASEVEILKALDKLMHLGKVQSLTRDGLTLYEIVDQPLVEPRGTDGKRRMAVTNEELEILNNAKRANPYMWQSNIEALRKMAVRRTKYSGDEDSDPYTNFDTVYQLMQLRVPTITKEDVIFFYVALKVARLAVSGSYDFDDESAEDGSQDLANYAHILGGAVLRRKGKVHTKFDVAGNRSSE